MAFRLQIVLLVLGGMACFYGVQEMRLSSSASDQPQQITLKDLIANGVGKNAHILLTHYTLAENFIYETSSKGSTQSWSKVWIPAVPVENAPLPAMPFQMGQRVIGGNIKALIKSAHVKSQPELNRLAGPNLQGMVINKIESLGSKEKKVLNESYPGVDFDKCLIIEEGRKPAGAGKVFAFLAGGLVLLFAGGIWMLIGFVSRR